MSNADQELLEIVRHTTYPRRENDILISKIKNTEDHGECLNAVYSYYNMAYNRGYEAGKAEGERKVSKKKKQPDTSSWDNVKEDPFAGGGW